MKTLLEPEVKAEIIGRLQKLTPESPRRWGRMTVVQMLCHLEDSYRLGMGEGPDVDRSNLFTRTVMKFGGLRVPMQWPKGIATIPELDQAAGAGTAPVEFARDRERLLRTVEQFAAVKRDYQFGRHALFGEMNEWEWMRWGYLHGDHHLRQFGV